jgi:CheY-like chemotaxis protein
MANLVANAIRYTDAGHVIVRCRLRGTMAWLQVWDSGRGIAPQDRQRIFEEFVQLDHTRSLGAEGLGLGLAIVHRVTQRLGHRVVLRSRPGRGSLFSIGVPLSGPVGPGAPHRSAEGQLAALLRGQLILLIDDDPVVLRSMQALLEAFECHVLTACSLHEAMQAVDDSLRTPDMVISDFRLGESCTGLDAIAQIRDRIGEAIPAMLVTADVGMARTAAHPHGIPVLAKPLQAGTLAAELGRALAA